MRVPLRCKIELSQLPSFSSSFFRRLACISPSSVLLSTDATQIVVNLRAWRRSRAALVRQASSQPSGLLSAVRQSAAGARCGLFGADQSNPDCTRHLFSLAAYPLGSPSVPSAILSCHSLVTLAVAPIHLGVASISFSFNSFSLIPCGNVPYSTAIRLATGRRGPASSSLPIRSAPICVDFACR